MTITTRRIRPADTAAFTRIAPDVFDEAVDPKRLAAYLAEPGHLMILAFDGDEVVGQVAAVIHRHPDKPTELYLDELGVTPDLHRRGIGERLFEEMIAWGKELGCEECWVGTEPDNDAARALYGKAGAEGEPFLMYLYEL